MIKAEAEAKAKDLNQIHFKSKFMKSEVSKLIALLFLKWTLNFFATHLVKKIMKLLANSSTESCYSKTNL